LEGKKKNEQTEKKEKRNNRRVQRVGERKKKNRERERVDMRRNRGEGQKRERKDNKKNRGGARERNKGDKREGKKTITAYTATSASTIPPSHHRQHYHQPLLHQLHRSKPFGHQELSLPPLFLPLQIFFSFFLPASATVYHHRLHPTALHANQTTVIPGQPFSPFFFLIVHCMNNRRELIHTFCLCMNNGREL